MYTFTRVHNVVAAKHSDLLNKVVTIEYRGVIRLIGISNIMSFVLQNDREDHRKNAYSRIIRWWESSHVTVISWSKVRGTTKNGTNFVDKDATIFREVSVGVI